SPPHDHHYPHHAASAGGPAARNRTAPGDRTGAEHRSTATAPGADLPGDRPGPGPAHRAADRTAHPGGATGHRAPHPAAAAAAASTASTSAARKRRRARAQRRRDRRTRPASDPAALAPRSRFTPTEPPVMWLNRRETSDGARQWIVSSLRNTFLGRRSTA